MIPTLVVPGHPDEWLPTRERCGAGCAEVHGCGAPCWWPTEAARCWVPVETLPAVPGDDYLTEDRGGGYYEIVAEPRPLRAGDTVELANWDDLDQFINDEYDADPGFGEAYEPRPFARATVAEVGRIPRDADDVQPFDIVDDLSDLPGDWSSARFGVRVTDVEALT